MAEDMTRPSRGYGVEASPAWVGLSTRRSARREAYGRVRILSAPLSGAITQVAKETK